MIKICEKCGQEYEAKKKDQKYCSNCSAWSRRNKDTEGMRRKYGHSLIKRTRDMTLNEIVKEADEAGMTYGEYVSRRDNEQQTERR